MESVHIRVSRPTGLNLAFTGNIYFGLYPCRKPSVIKSTHVRCSKPVHSNYYNCMTIKIQQFHKYILHVSAYSGHLKGGG